MTSTTYKADFMARLAAESAIRRLQAIYTNRLDRGDFSGVAETLRYAVLDVIGRVYSGYNAILAFVKDGRRLNADGTPSTFHTVANVRIEVDASETKATSSSYYTLHQRVAGFPPQLICTGNYLDEFELRATEWTFTRRALTVSFAGDLQDHDRDLHRDSVAEHA